MKTFTAASIFLSSIFPLSAQSLLSGRIMDGRGEALAGANVYLEGTYDGSSSNGQGEFTLKTEESGPQVLRIEFIGYRGRRLELELDHREMDLGDIQLREEVNELNAVTITAGTFEASDKKKSISLSPIDMVTTDGSSGDVYGALQALPGTTTVGESGRLYVKGGDSRESKTFIDGTLVYVPYSSSSPNQSVRGRFSPFMFSGMMFSTGGYSAEYGQALSSVLSLQTNGMGVEDQLNISILSVGAEVGGTLSSDRASGTANVGYYNLTPYMHLVPQNTRFEQMPRSLSGDLAFRLQTGKKGLLKFYATGSQQRLSTIEERLEQPGENFTYGLVNDNYFVNSSWAGELSENWILNAGLSFTHNTDHMRVDSMRVDESLQGSHSKLVLKHRVSDRLRILAGTEWYARSYGLAYPGSDALPSSSYQNHSLTGFMEAEIYASNRFVARAGLRYEHSSYLERSSLAPRISAAYKLGKAGQVSLAYGWFFQDPDHEFLLATAQLEFERADHYTLNYLMNHDRRMLRSELYYKDYKGLIRYGWEPELGYASLDNSGDGYAWGLDLFWRDRKTIKGGEYWISYSYIDARRDYRDYPTEAIPGYSSAHNLSLVYKHFFSALRSQLGSSYHFSSPRTYNNPNAAEFNGELTRPYHSLNMNWSLLLKQNVIFYFTVSNILGYEQDFGRSYARTPDANGIYASKPVLPGAKRWYLIGCFITLSRDGELNQLDKIN